MKDVKIIVATHKKYQMPKEEIYIPVHVGAEGKEKLEYVPDNKGENISSKNPYYCELTGLYWAWKNLKADYIGLVHYRRYFTQKSITLTKSENDRFKIVLNQEEIDDILNKTDIILPKKRKYYIETLYSHYKHTLHVETLEETRKIIEEKYPKYLEQFDKLHKRTYAHMFNMFIMKKDILDKYCEWLFDILFELEKRLPPTKYDSFHSRYIGRIAELLLDVWIDENKLEYKEVKIMNIQRVNWIKKGYAFLSAKFLGKKYDKSF